VSRPEEPKRGDVPQMTKQQFPALPILAALLVAGSSGCSHASAPAAALIGHTWSLQSVTLDAKPVSLAGANVTLRFTKLEWVGVAFQVEQRGVASYSGATLNLGQPSVDAVASSSRKPQCSTPSTPNSSVCRTSP
jgi:hypothetical protein